MQRRLVMGPLIISDAPQHITTSHFVVALCARCGSRLQRLNLLKDEVDLSLRRFIIIHAAADTHTKTSRLTLWLIKGIQTQLSSVF